MKDFVYKVYLLPYLSMGGSFTEFLELTPKEIEIYTQAYKIKKQEEMQMAWVHGYYMKLAIQSSIFVCGLADKKVINSMPKYPEIPKYEDDNIIEVQAKREYYIARLNQWQKINNSRNKK